MPQDILDIELKNVSKFFGDFTAVDKVSIQIKKGEFFSMLGPSGCGKTTTLRMIAGFEFPDEGEIYIAGEDVQNQHAYERKTNMVFQSLALFPHMNVYDNIAYGPMIRKVPSGEIKTKVSEMLRLVRLEGYEKRRVSQLSGGQKQRIAIARALVNEPKVLLLDEPLGALDLKLRLQMQFELKRIQKELGNTFVYVTHDQGEALTMSDKIAVMNQGRVEQFGTPREIYEHPATKFVAGFIGDTNLLSGVVKEPGGESAVIELAGGVFCKAYAPDFPAGSKVALSLRHERIRVTKAPPEGMENTVSATVTDVVYVGSMVKYHMALPGEIKLVAQLVNETGSEIFAPGDLVTASWNQGDSIVLAD